MLTVKLCLRVAKSVPSEKITKALKARALKVLRAKLAEHAKEAVQLKVVESLSEADVRFQIRQKNGALVLHHDHGIPF